MRNLEIRQTAKEHGVKLWQVAEALGMADSSLSRKLRRELPEADKRRMLAIIIELAKGVN